MLNRISAATLGLLGLLAFAPPAPPAKTKVYLIGNSTMANKVPATFSETGWDMPLTTFFYSTVVVDNRAQNGRSTRTFLTENRWQPVVDALRPADYVLIQFGYNDESPDKVDRYTAQLVANGLRAQRVGLFKQPLAKALPKNMIATPIGKATQPTTP